MSVQLSKCGWAWLVCGRRLLIWQYKQNGPSKWQSVSQCRELTLPPSDLAHRAELVIVYTSKKASTPSCIAVSPEAVRYWPSIAHEGSWIEESTDLQVTNSWFCVWNRASFSVNCIIFFVGDLKIFLFFSYTHMILFNQLRKQFLKHEFDHAKCNKMALSFYTKPDTPFKAYVKSQILKAVRPIRTM